MDYVINKKILESEKDLFVSKNGFAWTSSPPRNVMTYDDSFLQKNCIRTLMHLSGLDVDTRDINSNYKNALKQFSEKIPLGIFMPIEEYKRYIRGIIEKINSCIDDENQYYYKHYKRHDVIFDSLMNAVIDKERLQYYATKKDNFSNMHVLASFLPDDSGHSKKIKYDRLTSRTGRLKVESGPSILTLKKDQRDIIKSRYKNGKIISIDYANLESRVFLYSSNISLGNQDIYEFIAKNVFNDEYPRHIIKTIVISLLYGMGDVAMSAKLNLDKSKVKKISKKIRAYFKYDDLYETLQKKVNEGKIQNHYGRSIHVPDDRVLLNTYVQSSAVDVALHGFSNMIDEIPKEGCTPIFILHDALILDIEENCDLSFVKAGERVPLFENTFPVHVSRF